MKLIDIVKRKNVMSLSKEEALSQILILEAENAAIEIVSENVRNFVDISSKKLEEAKNSDVKLILNNVVQQWTKLLITVVQEDIRILEKKKALGDLLFAEFGIPTEKTVAVSSKVH
jgi:hypothetical protein